jgi:actin-related protein
MNLENEFQDVRLTENEFRRCTRNIKREYAKTKTEERIYTYRDLNDIFKETNIGKELSTKIINQELQKTRAYKTLQKKTERKVKEQTKYTKPKKRKERFRKGGRNLGKKLIEPILLGALIFSFVGIVGMCTSAIVDGEKDRNRFRESYGTALIRYADTNGDGIITSDEESVFNYDFLKGKGVLYNGEKNVFSKYPAPTYLNGEYVPVEDMAKWLDSYQPKE